MESTLMQNGIHEYKTEDGKKGEQQQIELLRSIKEMLEKRLDKETRGREEAERKLAQKTEEVYKLSIEKNKGEIENKANEMERLRLEMLLDKENEKREDLEKQTFNRNEEVDKWKNKYRNLRYGSGPVDIEELKKRRSKRSEKVTSDLTQVLEAMSMLEQELKQSEEQRTKHEEIVITLLREKEEAKNAVTIAEAGLKTKGFALENLRQKLFQTMKEMENKKIKAEKVKSDFQAIHEDFVKLKSEFDTQLNWIANSANSTETEKKAWDLLMIPQQYRPMVFQQYKERERSTSQSRSISKGTAAELFQSQEKDTVSSIPVGSRPNSPLPSGSSTPTSSTSTSALNGISNLPSVNSRPSSPPAIGMGSAAWAKLQEIKEAAESKLRQGISSESDPEEKTEYKSYRQSVSLLHSVQDILKNAMINRDSLLVSDEDETGPTLSSDDD